MTTWQKIKMWVWRILSPHTLADYVMGQMNGYLARTNVAEDVAKTRDSLDYAFTWLTRLRIYCPASLVPRYDEVRNAVAFLRRILDDGQISGAEVQAAVEGVKLACEKWEVKHV